MADEPTRVLLIRHGLNDFISNHQLAGRMLGVHLNDRGHGQAQALAERLATASLAAIYTSPLDRTVETAAPIATCHGISAEQDERLVESECGEWTGQSIEELSKTEVWRQFQVLPSTARFPGGESFAEIQARIVGAIEELRHRHAGQTVAIVSHSDPIKLALAHYIGMHMDMFQRLVIDPASISELEFGIFQPRLLRCNDCAHLASDAGTSGIAA